MAVDARLVCDFTAPAQWHRPNETEIVAAMSRIFHPKAVAVIGASDRRAKSATP